MPSNEEQFAPGSPVDLVIRPLDKGIVLDKPSHLTQKGSLINAKNCIITTQGIKRTPSYLRYDGGTVDDDQIYPPFVDILVFWRTDGTRSTIAIDQKFIYTINAVGNFTRALWTFTAAINVTVTGTGVEAAADTHWNDAVNEIRAGDVFVYDTAGTEKYGTISGVTDGDTLVLATAPGNYGPGANWLIRRAFGATNPYLIDWTIIPDNDDADDSIVVFADATRYLYSFNGTTFTDHAAGNAYIPVCCAFFKSRLWIGNISDGTDTWRQRIRWTQAGDYDDFADGGYIDLPYTQGAIKRLVPMGKALVAYFDDAIFVGLPTNQPSLPLAFQQIETGGRGLVGMKAVVPYMDGHFIVCQDNIYFFSLTNGLQPVGNPVVKRTIEECDDERRWKIYATHDLLNKCILFGFPKDGDEFEEVWAFNYESKSWSWIDLTGDFLAHANITGTVTWGSMTGDVYEVGTVTTNGTTTVEGAGGMDWDANCGAGDTILIDVDDDGTFSYEAVIDTITDADTLVVLGTAPAAAAGVDYRIVDANLQWADFLQTWQQQMPTSLLSGNTFFSNSTQIFYLTGDGALNLSVTAPAAVIETADLDENAPSKNKTWLELGVKLEDIPSAELTFLVFGSVDRGQQWKTLGTITIDADQNESRTCFRLTGTMARFRLTSNSAVSPYTINEITYRVRGVGREIPGRD